jgi:hypothetical protein
MARHATMRGRSFITASVLLAIITLTRPAGGTHPARPSFGVPDTMSTVRGTVRDSAEFAALKADWDADLFDGIPGLRRSGHGVQSVTGWRCFGRLVNGHPPTPIDVIDFRNLDWARNVRAHRVLDAPAPDGRKVSMFETAELGRTAKRA